jgi:hypothetical protein
MISKTIQFHEVAKDELPKDSGEYLCLSANEYGVYSIMGMGYSSKHKLFNVSDYDNDTSRAIGVTYWAEIPDMSLTDIDEIKKQFVVTINDSQVRQLYDEMITNLLNQRKEMYNQAVKNVFNDLIAYAKTVQKAGYDGIGVEDLKQKFEEYKS